MSVRIAIALTARCPALGIAVTLGSPPPRSGRGAGGGGRSFTRPAGVILAIAALLAIACRSDRSATSPAPSAEPASTAVATRPTSAREAARVLRVIDGDTILVEVGGRQERVRYIGLDTPETVAPDRPPGCFGQEASAANAALVEGKTVQMERDISERDRFDRLLRYVYVDGVFVNEELLRRGYASAATFPPDVREAARFRSVEREARDAGRGLWGACRR